MTDFVLVLATVAFIALCVAYVGWCDRIIIGPDDHAVDAHAVDDRRASRDGVTVP